MNNPYIKDEQCPIIAEQNAPSAVDEMINNAAQKLPFVPENFNISGFIKGLLVGGISAYILTNPKAQDTLFKAIIKGGSLINAGIEELKERFEDAKAELEAQK